MTDLDPERFTLCQAAQARDDFAQIMDELKVQLARLPTRRNQAFIPLRIMLGGAIRWVCHPLVRGVLAAVPLRAGPGCLVAIVVALLLIR